MIRHLGEHVFGRKHGSGPRLGDRLRFGMVYIARDKQRNVKARVRESNFHRFGRP